MDAKHAEWDRLLEQARRRIHHSAEAVQRAKREFPGNRKWINEKWDAFNADCEYFREICRAQEQSLAHPGVLTVADASSSEDGPSDAPSLFEEYPYLYPELLEARFAEEREAKERAVAMGTVTPVPRQSNMRPRVCSHVERTHQYDRYRAHIPASVERPYEPTALAHSQMEYQPVRAVSLESILEGVDCYRRGHLWFGFVGTVFHLRMFERVMTFAVRDQWGGNAQVVIYADAASGKRDEPPNLVLHYVTTVGVRCRQRYLILFHREWLTRPARPTRSGARVEVRLKLGSMPDQGCYFKITDYTGTAPVRFEFTPIRDDTTTAFDSLSRYMDRRVSAVGIVVRVKRLHPRDFTPSLFIVNSKRQLIAVNASGANFAQWPLTISRRSLVLRIVAVRDALPRVDSTEAWSGMTLLLDRRSAIVLLLPDSEYGQLEAVRRLRKMRSAREILQLGVTEVRPHANWMDQFDHTAVLVHPTYSINGEIYGNERSTGGTDGNSSPDDSDDSDVDPTDSEGETDTGRSGGGYKGNNGGKNVTAGSGTQKSSAQPTTTQPATRGDTASATHSSPVCAVPADALAADDVESLASQLKAKCYLPTTIRPNIYGTHVQASAPFCSYDSHHDSCSHSYDYINAQVEKLDSFSPSISAPVQLTYNDAPPYVHEDIKQLCYDSSRAFDDRVFWLEDMPEDAATRAQRDSVARQLGDNRDNSTAITLMELQRLQPAPIPKPLFAVVLNHINKDLVGYYNNYLHKFVFRHALCLLAYFRDPIFSDIKPTTIVYRPVRHGERMPSWVDLDWWINPLNGRFGLLAPRQFPSRLNGPRQKPIQGSVAESDGTGGARHAADVIAFTGTFHIAAGQNAAPSPSNSAYAASIRHLALAKPTTRGPALLFQSALTDIEAAIYSLLRIAKGKLLKWQSKSRKHVKLKRRLLRQSVVPMARDALNMAAKKLKNGPKVAKRRVSKNISQLLEWVVDRAERANIAALRWLKKNGRLANCPGLDMPVSDAREGAKITAALSELLEDDGLKMQ